MSDGGGQFKSFGPFFDSNGTIYRGIRVNVFAAGTTNNKTYWTTENKGTPGAFPLVDADLDGIVSAFFDGDYRFQIKDSAGLDLDDVIDWDNVKVTSDTGAMWEGNAGTSLPAVSAANRWQMAVQHTAGNVFENLFINDGTKFLALNGNKVFRSEWYSDFNAAVAAIAATEATLVISSTTVVTATVSSPSTLALLFEGQGKLSINAPQVLTVNGPFYAPMKHVITGPGKIIISTGSTPWIHPQWWGAKGDGVTDSTSAFAAMILNAIDAVGSKMFTPGGTYMVDSVDLSNLRDSIFSGSGTNTKFHARGNGVHFFTLNTGTGGQGGTHPTNIRRTIFRDFTLSANSFTFTGKAIYIDFMTDSRLDNIRIKEFSDQLFVNFSWLNHFSQIVNELFTGTAIELSKDDVNAVTFVGGRITAFNAGIPAGTVGIDSSANNATFINCDMESVKIGFKHKGKSNQLLGCQFEGGDTQIETGNFPSTAGSLTVENGFFFKPALWFINWDGTQLSESISVRNCHFKQSSILPLTGHSQLSALRGEWVDNVYEDEAAAPIAAIRFQSFLSTMHLRDGAMEWFDPYTWKRRGRLASIATASPGTQLFRLPKNKVGFEITLYQRLAASAVSIQKCLVQISETGAISQSTVATAGFSGSIGTAIGATFEWDDASKEVRAFATATSECNFIAEGSYTGVIPTTHLPEASF